MKMIPSLKGLIIAKKRIFVRADLNIPMKDGIIFDDFRLQKILPTINYIQQQGGKVILATHIGRPKSMNEHNLSTDCIAEWLEQHGYTVFLEKSLDVANQDSHSNFSSILLLENLRFFQEEQGRDGEKLQFAKKLKSLADIYVNDAFGLIHRNDASVTTLPQQFGPQNRSVGLLVEQELQHLTLLKETPQQPFFVVLGGKKIEDKIALLKKLITAQKKQKPAGILLGGLLSLYFLQAKEPSHNLLPNDHKEVLLAQQILSLADKNGVTIHLPKDLTIQPTPHTPKASSHASNVIQKVDSVIDIGPETIKQFEQVLAPAQTIFANGTMGIYEQENAQQGTAHILHAISNASAYRVIGGGDAVSASRKFQLADTFDFLSTGGGATLAFLAAQSLNELPSLAAL